MRIKKIFILLLCLSLFLPSISLSERKFPYEPTMEELRYLPEFCTVRIMHRMDRKYADVRKWQKIMGNDWLYMHHYCGAQAQILRGFREPTEYKRKWQWGRSLANFDFVLRNASKGFYLRPDIHLRRGQVFLLLNSQAEAIKEFSTALKIKSDYVPAYLALANVYVDLNSRNDAIQILEIGLKHNPDSIDLKNALDKLKKN